MFNREEKNINETETIIGSSVKVKGGFVSKGNIVVDGEFEGSLETAGNIHIGETANIKANVIASNGIIHGTLLGNITLKEKLEIGKSAVISGDIICNNLAISAGAVINGKIQMGKIETETTPIQ